MAGTGLAEAPRRRPVRARKVAMPDFMMRVIVLARVTLVGIGAALQRVGSEA